ncbi:hypothetical protein CAEBREN_08256 [Caenorhabditis brenneri]|uniref:Uncharacterized protein n=1 Tax=Caenorhabditis brenneri TaxID=135651 RepID=G0PDZ0_CAEBE|nr:hypothetical protein CAEBREN_08256 [Caenorhabditis brenneri]
MILKTSMLLFTFFLLIKWKTATSLSYTSVDECNNAFLSVIKWVPVLKKCDGDCMKQTYRLQAQKILAGLNAAIIDLNHLNPNQTDRTSDYLVDEFEFTDQHKTVNTQEEIVELWKSLPRGERVFITCIGLNQFLIRRNLVGFVGHMYGVYMPCPEENKLVKIDLDYFDLVF